MYDKGNIFAKIINGDLPATKIYEDDQLLAIRDIKPVAPIHVLVIPKDQYQDFADFSQNASSDQIAHYFRKIGQIAAELGASEYRIVSNNGTSAGQSVFHFHTHIIAGAKFSKLI